MWFLRKKGSVLLIMIIVLAIVCPLRVHMYKTKIEQIKSGELKLDSSEYLPADLHPESAYLIAVPYIIIEVTLCTLYYVRTRD